MAISLHTPSLSATPLSTPTTKKTSPPLKLLHFPSSIPSRRRPPIFRCHSSSDSSSTDWMDSKTLDRIPKQFREENLIDGLMENYKNVPQHLYGLSPSQMSMFMTEDSAARQLPATIPEESLSAARSYHNNVGKPMNMLEAMSARTSASASARTSARMNTRILRGRRGRKRNPPDLPSLLLNNRIVFLGMPIDRKVAELIMVQLMWLDYDDDTKPIYLYLNSTGTRDHMDEIVGSEQDAFLIADSLGFCKGKLCTVNIGIAAGQAAMLLSLGNKGFRFLQPHSLTRLYLPKAEGSSGSTGDMYVKAKQHERDTDYYLELLSKGTGKPKEELREDIQYRQSIFGGQAAIDYGIADKFITNEDEQFESKAKNNHELLLQSKAMRQARGDRGSQAAPSGLM